MMREIALHEMRDLPFGSVVDVVGDMGMRFSITLGKGGWENSVTGLPVNVETVSRGVLTIQEKDQK